MSEDLHLTVDSTRLSAPETGICVRAVHEGRYDSVDIAHLDRTSLRTWLRSHGVCTETVVAILLGHSGERRRDPTDHGCPLCTVCGEQPLPPRFRCRCMDEYISIPAPSPKATP